MILFRSGSKNNIYKAINENIWQCNSAMPQKLKVGDAAFIKMNGEEELHFLGLVESISREDVLIWPDQQPDSLTINVPTIRFKKPDRHDFKTSQGNFNYDIYGNEELVTGG
jgi:hypothetical protein